MTVQRGPACTLIPAASSTVKSTPAPGETLRERKQTLPKEHMLLFCISSDACSEPMGAEKILLMGLPWP